MGHWCPYCNTHVSENICRQYFENIFGKRFPKSRPKWLIGTRGRLQELDGFCQELNLAFEYNGKQHYDDSFGYLDVTLQKRQADDENKRRLCLENKITLIEIPYTIKRPMIGEYIVEQCKTKEITVPEIDLSTIDYRNFVYQNSEVLDKCKKRAIEKGGRCLSETYIDYYSKLKFECKLKHTWETIAYNILRINCWCPHCKYLKAGATQRLDIEQMRKVAEKMGGECLSSEYKNTITKLVWRCKKEHTWPAVPSSVLHGSWCPTCYINARSIKARKHTIDEMHRLAESKGGDCLSKEFTSIHKKLKWICKENHIWFAIPWSLMRGAWCPVCGHKQTWITRKASVPRIEDSTVEKCGKNS
jgi:hypothetical protein